MRRLLTLPLLGLAMGCTRPPPAPAELDDLCAYLYTWFEDPRAMEDGLANLYQWLNTGENLDQTLEGYEVNVLSEDAVDTLDERDRAAANLLGAAVGTQGSGNVEEVAYTLIVVEPEDLSPGMYELYQRTVTEGSYNAFMSRDEDFLQVFNHMESVYASGLAEATTETNGQYRWYQMDKGPAMVQRTWMDEPADFIINMDIFPDISLNEQFFLNVVMPTGQGSLRLQATWFDFTLQKEGCSEDPTQEECQLGDMLESLAISNFIGSMQDVYVDVDAWIEEQGTETSSGGGGCSASGRARGGWISLSLLGALLGLARRRQRE